MEGKLRVFKGRIIRALGRRTIVGGAAHWPFCRPVSLSVRPSVCQWFCQIAAVIIQTLL